MENPELSNDNYLFVPLDNQENPPVNVSHYGWHKCSSSHTNYFSLKRCFTLHIILHGKGYYCRDGIRHELHANDFFLINPAETISYYPDKEDPWEYIWFGLTGNGANAFLKELGVIDTLVASLKSTDRIIDLFEILKNKTSRSGLSVFGYYSIFMAIFDELISQVILPAPRSNNGNTLIERALDYISEHYGSNISISKMSDFLCVERTTLFKAFKKSFNLSPQQYIITYRLRIAQQYICETQQSFMVIAWNCGFSNYSHFSKSFAAHFGCSPSAMRKSVHYGGVPSVALPDNPPLSQNDEKNKTPVSTE